MNAPKKRGRGRPPISDEPGQRFQVHLPPRVAKIVKKQGKGSISAGIRWTPVVMRELNKEVIRENERRIAKLESVKSGDMSAAKQEAVRLRLANDELRSLVRQDEAWERRQKAFIAVHAQFLPHGNGQPTMENLDEFDAADAEWKAAKAEADRIVQEIREGRR